MKYCKAAATTTPFGQQCEMTRTVRALSGLTEGLWMSWPLDGASCTLARGRDGLMQLVEILAEAADLICSSDAALMFLRSPAARERASKHGDGEIGGCSPIGDGFDYTRRHEGERGKVSDVAADFLGSGDLLE
jgi:hypothetical protein